MKPSYWTSLEKKKHGKKSAIESDYFSPECDRIFHLADFLYSSTLVQIVKRGRQRGGVVEKYYEIMNILSNGRRICKRMNMGKLDDGRN
jgi:hypothetical protein